MRCIHTADWHIGQSFFGYDRKEEHAVFFDWLRSVVKERQVDALLIAGDVFDSPNPSAESQKLFYRFLRRITLENPCLQIVVTAGNHDSAARLEAPNPLLEEMNVYIKGFVRKDAEGNVDAPYLFVPLQQAGKTEAWCIAVPYLRQGDYPNAESYVRGVKALYEQLYEKMQEVKAPGQAIVVMGHLQATGSEISENDRSERTVVGGLECVSPEVFDKKDIVYTALGHLHKAQRVSNREQVRYAGSPLPMSFAEKNYKQGVNLIEIDNGSLTRLERIAFEPPVKLISLPEAPQLLSEVLDAIGLLPDGEAGADSPYLELKVLIAEPEPSMRSRIEEALKNKPVRLAHAVPYRIKPRRESGGMPYEELKALSPLDMAEDVFQSRYGNPMPKEMKSLLQQVIEEASR